MRGAVDTTNRVNGVGSALIILHYTSYETGQLTITVPQIIFALVLLGLRGQE